MPKNSETPTDVVRPFTEKMVQLREIFNFARGGIPGLSDKTSRRVFKEYLVPTDTTIIGIVHAFKTQYVERRGKSQIPSVAELTSLAALQRASGTPSPAPQKTSATDHSIADLSEPPFTLNGRKTNKRPQAGQAMGPRSDASNDELKGPGKSEAIQATERKLGRQFDYAMDGLIVLCPVWNYYESENFAPVAIEVSPNLSTMPALETLPAKFREMAQPHMAESQEKFGQPNGRKLWLRSFREPLKNRPELHLNVGETDYWTTKSLEKVYDTGVLRAKYESSEWGIEEELPGLVGTATVITTSDDRLILTQRHSRNVDFAGGRYSPSFDEQWDLARDTSPIDTVVRGASEEFDLDPSRDISLRNIRLMALAREWGKDWNTVLVFSLSLALPAKAILDLWKQSKRPDKREARAVVAVPFSKSSGADFLMRLIADRNAAISVREIRDASGDDFIRGSPTDGELDEISGRARIWFGLFARSFLPKT